MEKDSEDLMLARVRGACKPGWVWVKIINERACFDPAIPQR